MLLSSYVAPPAPSSVKSLVPVWSRATPFEVVKTLLSAYNEWMEQIPQLVQKYLKGKVYQVSKVSCRYTECGSVERDLDLGR